MQGSDDLGFRCLYERSKPPETIEGLIKRLGEKGLEITDKEKAGKYLRTIGYERLLEYCRPYYNDGFKPETKIQHIIDLYDFDRKLRLLVMDPIEKVDVFIRTTISDYMLHVCGDAFWYYNVDKSSKSLFSQLNKKNSSENERKKNEFKKVIGEMQEVSKKIKVSSPSRLSSGSFEVKFPFFESLLETLIRMSRDERCPKDQRVSVGVLFEHITLDCIITLFKSLPEKHQKAIIEKFQLSFLPKYPENMADVLYCFKSLRNIVAHYNPLLNATCRRTHGVKKIMRDAGYQDFPLPNDQDKEPFPTYAYFVVLYRLCRSLHHCNSEEDTLKWKEKLSELLKNCHIDVCQHMHFPEKWEELAFWKKSISSSTCPNPNY